MKRRDKLDDISQEELQRLFDYNPETGIVTRKTAPALISIYSEIRAVAHGDGYLQVRISGVNYNLHRVIYKIMTGVTPSVEIDHLNHDPLDNRWENLRLASREAANIKYDYRPNHDRAVIA
tara:strand:- start:513 stop:875 length:363 start_codon:yes stop_codon:yes gene_type:complete